MHQLNRYQIKIARNTNRKFQRDNIQYYCSNMDDNLNALDKNNESKFSKNGRFNEVGIQMIHETTRKYLFGKKKEEVNQANIQKAKKHLEKFGLLDKKTDILKDVTTKIKLPKLFGGNIHEHFTNIAHQYTHKYLKIISLLCSTKEIPEMPKQFNFSAGWTMYFKIIYIF